MTRPQSPELNCPRPAPTPLRSPRATASDCVQPGRGITGGQPPSATLLAGLSREKGGWRAQGFPQFRRLQPQIPRSKGGSRLASPAWVRVSPRSRANSYLEAASIARCSRPRHSNQRAGGDGRRDYSVRGTRGARGRAGVTVPARAAAAAAA